MNIKEIRQSLGMSARQFGLAAGLKGRHIARTVYRWETGDQAPNHASQQLIRLLPKVNKLLRKKL